jgi:microcystin degradation protein MlrC
MRIAIAQIWQETNTFCPLLTGLEAFEQNGLFLGDEIMTKMRGVGELGGFIDAAEEIGNIVYIPIVRAWAMSSGRITTNALRFLEEELISGLKRAIPVDGVLLSLHGASAAQGIDDPTGYLLSKIRKIIGSSIPIVISLDHHCNVTQEIVHSVDALVAYSTQPHDPYETSVRAAKLLFDIINKNCAPTIGWQKIPMLAPADRGLTSEFPMKKWFDLAREIEKRPGVISVSTFPTQPWLDVKKQGWTSVVITDHSLPLAEALARELADEAWNLRDEFWKVRRVPVEDAIRQAIAAKEGPIIISDASDSVLSGATGDSTVLLKEMLRQNIPSLALLPIVDPEVVEQALISGEGSEMTIWIGGKLDKLFGEPILVTGKVAKIAQSALVSSFPGWGSAYMGKTVLFECNNIKLLVSESGGAGGTDPEIYRQLGVDPAQAKIIVVKTYYHYQHYRSMMKAAIMVDGRGLSDWDLRKFEWKNVPRPIYPLDEISDWQATGY